MATITTDINASVRQLVFNVTGVGSVTLHAERLSPEVMAYAALHGLKQRISDAAALSRDDTTGKPAMPAEKLAAMQQLVDFYETGTKDWNRKREGGSRISSDVGILTRALCELRPEKTRESIETYVANLKANEVRALLGHGPVKAIADRIREEAGKGIDADALLNGLV
jgi:hypothetical protein